DEEPVLPVGKGLQQRHNLVVDVLPGFRVNDQQLSLIPVDEVLQPGDVPARGRGSDSGPLQLCPSNGGGSAGQVSDTIKGVVVHTVVYAVRRAAHGELQRLGTILHSAVVGVLGHLRVVVGEPTVSPIDSHTVSDVGVHLGQVIRLAQ